MHLSVTLCCENVQKIEQFQIMSSSDSEFEGLERVSSVKERKEKCYSEVPENKKYKLKIIDTEKTDKIGYKLKKGTKLPYNTILKGSNSSISSTCLISI